MQSLPATPGAPPPADPQLLRLSREGLQWPAPRRGLRAPHVVDTTMFWSATGGGVRRYILAKQAWLREHTSWRHTLVAPRARGPGSVDCGGVPLPLTGGYSLPLSRAAAARRIEALEPDLIEAGDPYQLAWAALDAARERHVPSVLFCHSNIGALAARLLGGPHTAGPLARGARRAAEAYLRRTASRFDLVLAPSRMLAQELQQIGLPQVQCQPLGVDTQVFHPGARDAIWRHALELPRDARVLLYAGRFAPEKNLPQLVRAVERLGERYWLLAVGAGPLPPSGRRVRVLPFERHAFKLARVMASVDAFVHAGDQETFGLSVLEAMACGTPVAVRAAGALPELVADGAGVVVHGSSPDEWAGAIEALFSSQRAPYIRGGLERARAHDWHAVMSGLQRRYARLLRSHAPRPGRSPRPPVRPPDTPPQGRSSSPVHQGATQ